ncbi:glycine-rich cell wall structural protein-like [Salvia splendens]|uniref:glycine-rich cell wall structural protein-like n=1 Tax=Salvia splendens TaxID=180675 RepID=UPI001C2665BA|nr:glycine-rich cell wall structural protein-like [Salvia splendens]
MGMNLGNGKVLVMILLLGLVLVQMGDARKLEKETFGGFGGGKEGGFHFNGGFGSNVGFGGGEEGGHGVGYGGGEGGEHGGYGGGRGGWHGGGEGGEHASGCGEHNGGVDGGHGGAKVVTKEESTVEDTEVAKKEGMVEVAKEESMVELSVVDMEGTTEDMKVAKEGMVVAKEVMKQCMVEVAAEINEFAL